MEATFAREALQGVLLPFYAALIVAAVFYVLLPVIGAYITRDQWRRFRERLLVLSRSPRLRLGAWAGSCATTRLEGSYRFHGEIEAIEGEERLWVRGSELTAVVDLGTSAIHILRDEGGEASAGRYALVQRVPWKRVRVFPESARVYVGGAVRIEDGTPVFFDDPDEALLVVSYEGSEAGLLPRLIAGGRRDNEYWNPLSRASIALGMGSLGLYVVLSGGHWFPTVLFLTILASFAPVLGLLPPGLIFFFLYRRFWRRARDERVVRDLCRLPLRFSAADDAQPRAARDAPLPEGGVYRVARTEKPPEGLALLVPRPGERIRAWTVFTPEATDDPEVEPVAVAGEPAIQSARSQRLGLVATLLAGLSLAASLAVNAVAAFMLWRTL